MDRLAPESTVLVVVDVQEKLSVAMPEDALQRLVANVAILIESASLLNVKVLATEQYAKGLGPTIPVIAQKLRAIGVAPIAKMEFDACDNLHFARELTASGARAAVVVGMEAHVCVFQTARELARRGFATHVVSDAVASRREENRHIGLSLCERAGAEVTSTEVVVFDWLRMAGTDVFRAVSKLVR